MLVLWFRWKPSVSGLAAVLAKVKVTVRPDIVFWTVASSVSTLSMESFRVTVRVIVPSILSQEAWAKPFPPDGQRSHTPE